MFLFTLSLSTRKAHSNTPGSFPAALPEYVMADAFSAPPQNETAPKSHYTGLKIWMAHNKYALLWKTEREGERS